MKNRILLVMLLASTSIVSTSDYLTSEAKFDENGDGTGSFETLVLEEPLDDDVESKETDSDSESTDLESESDSDSDFIEFNEPVVDEEDTEEDTSEDNQSDDNDNILSASSDNSSPSNVEDLNPVKMPGWKKSDQSLKNWASAWLMYFKNKVIGGY